MPDLNLGEAFRAVQEDRRWLVILSYVGTEIRLFRIGVCAFNEPNRPALFPLSFSFLSRRTALFALGNFIQIIT